MNQYSALVMRHFTEPRHVGTLADGYDRILVGRAGQREHGTEVVFHLGIEGGRIAAVRFQAFGCPHTLAACSLVAERLTGAPVEAQGEIRPAALAAELEAPAAKMGRFLVIEDALRRGLAAWDNTWLGR